jgi:thermostable 8-oxoguanine DNA glycosylase
MNVELDEPRRIHRMTKIYATYDMSAEPLNFKFEYNPEETAALHMKLNGATAITADDLRQVSLWKSDRTLNVSDETLAKLAELSAKTHVTIDDPIVKEVLEMLVDSQGIGLPMASSILKFINPKVFPIIDVRAYRALTGTKAHQRTYTVDNYIAYTKQLTAIAAKWNRPLRDIDEQLYCFDKKHNKKI